LVRGRQALLVVAGTLVVLGLRERERRDAAIRATRATITTTIRAVAMWRADHDGACPPSLGELVAIGHLRALPRDAWGRPLRLTCPGRVDRRGYEVLSDGPDGKPGGVDQVQ
jgi:general secretion pathway protein G